MDELYNDIFKADGRISREELQAYFNNTLSDRSRNRIERILQDSELEHEAFEGFEEHPQDIGRVNNLSRRNPFQSNNAGWASITSIAAAAVVSLFVVSTQIIDQTLPAELAVVEEQTPEKINAPKAPEDETKIEEADEPVAVQSVVDRDNVIPSTEPEVLSVVDDQNPSVDVQEDIDGEIMFESSVQESPSIESLDLDDLAQEDEVSADYEDKELQVNRNGLNIPPGYELLKRHLILAYEDHNMTDTDGSTQSLSPQYSSRENVEERYAEEKEVVTQLYYEDVLRLGLTAFEKRNYLEAIQQFNLILAKEPNDLNAMIYKALSEYELGNLNNALPIFEKVASMDNSAFGEISEWNIALITFQQDPSEGRVLLEAIRDAEGFYARQAHEVLSRQ